MAHILAMGGRDSADDSEELVRLTDVPEQIHIDMSYYSVPNDAAFLKHFTPLYISSNGAKPQYMWASREFEADRSMSTFPAYIMSGFGMLDAFMHAYATNSTLVLHPLDIVLSICYAYGTERKKPIFHNNEELKTPMQIVLRQQFTRCNLLMAMVARLARRVETFPLGKLYSLINTEMSSPDPLVIRLVIGVLSYLAATRDTTKFTVDQFRNLYDLYNQSKADQQLIDSPIPTGPGMLDVRHDPKAPTWRTADSSEACNRQQQVTGASWDHGGNAAAINDVVVMATSAVPRDCDAAPAPATVWFRPDNVSRLTSQRDVAENAAATAADTEAAAAAGPSDAEALAASADGGATDEMKILGDWRLAFDMESTAECALGVTGGREETPVAVAKASRPSALDVLSMVSSDETQQQPQQPQPQVRGANNSNLIEEQAAAEWTLRPRMPSRLYKFKKESGIHSVLFKGNHKAWLELPEVLHELCQFFMLDTSLQTKIIEIGLSMQRTRLNPNKSNRKWWQKALFKEGSSDPLPDGDYRISGWLAVLIGGPQVAEHCTMTVNKLCSHKLGAKLPMLLVRLPANAMEDTDDSVLESEAGLLMTRLNYYDEYREKLANSSSNANEVPVWLFMPWRSCDALNRTRRLWRQVGGDAPAVQKPPPAGATGRTRGARNRNNTDTRVRLGHVPDRDQGMPDNEVSIKLWTPRQPSAGQKSGICSCCSRRSRRRNEVTEPVYNMSCLLSGVGGFCLQQPGDLTGAITRTCVRPLCFFEIAHEE